MVWDIIKDGFLAIIDSFRTFQGSGLIVVLTFLALIYLAYSSKNRFVKDTLLKYPIYVLLIFFCPIWYVYVYLFSDHEILYRLLWILPFGVVICYVFTELIFKLQEKIRPVALAVGIVILVISGEYTYGNQYFSRAQNIYHVPDTVVNICNEIEIEGREIRAAFPDELINYVRQYSGAICLPYGRDNFMDLSAWQDELQVVLRSDVINTEKCAYLLRDTETAYLIVSSEKRFTESLSNYDFVYVTTVDGYDIFLDNNAYIGIDFINYR